MSGIQLDFFKKQAQQLNNRISSLESKVTYQEQLIKSLESEKFNAYRMMWAFAKQNGGKIEIEKDTLLAAAKEENTISTYIDEETGILNIDAITGGAEEDEEDI